MATNVNRGNIAASVDNVLYVTANRGCTKFFLAVPAASSYGILVHVDGLHAADTYMVIPAGKEREFEVWGNGIIRVAVQGDGGTATNVIWGAVSKTVAGL